MTTIFDTPQSVPSLEAKLAKLHETKAAAQAEADSIAQAMTLALAKGEGLDDLNRRHLMIHATLNALPGALATLEGELAEAKRQAHKAEAAKRMAQVEALPAILGKHAQAVHRALEAFADATEKALAELPSGVADTPSYTNSDSWALAFVLGGQRVRELASHFLAVPEDLRGRAEVSVRAFDRTGR